MSRLYPAFVASALSLTCGPSASESPDAPVAPGPVSSSDIELDVEADEPRNIANYHFVPVRGR